MVRGRIRIKSSDTVYSIYHFVGQLVQRIENFPKDWNFREQTIINSSISHEEGDSNFMDDMKQPFDPV